MFRFRIRLRAAISLSPSPKTEYLYSARMMLSRGSDERLVDERTIYHAAKRTTVSPVNRNVKHGSGEYRWHFEPAPSIARELGRLRKRRLLLVAILGAFRILDMVHKYHSVKQRECLAPVAGLLI